MFYFKGFIYAERQADELINQYYDRAQQYSLNHVIVKDMLLAQPVLKQNIVKVIPNKSISFKIQKSKFKKSFENVLKHLESQFLKVILLALNKFVLGDYGTYVCVWFSLCVLFKLAPIYIC